MALMDLVNKTFREFRRYTGDGKPGEPTNAPLPVGDPSSGEFSPQNWQIREVFGAVGDEADRAEAAADRAEQAAEDVTAGLVADGAVSDPKLAQALAQQIVRAVANRTALKAIDTARIRNVFLLELGREGFFAWKSGDYSAQVASDTAEGLFVKATAIAASTGAWVRQYDGSPHAEWFGVVGDNATDNGAAILAAHVALRSNPRSLSNDGLTGKAITTYTSRKLEFGPGIFRIPSGLLRIYQDVNLRWQGAGHRGATNYMRAATTILFTGTAAWGMQLYGNGARGFAAYDMDICYESSSFTGDIVRVVGAPYFEPERCYFGTFGVTGAERQFSARSCISVSFDEFFNPRTCVFDGAKIHIKIEDQNRLAAFTGSITSNVLNVSVVSSGELGVGLKIWDNGVDTGRSIVSLGTGTGGAGTYNISSGVNLSSRPLEADIPFGGSNSHIQDCIFYDATIKHIEFRGARARHSQKLTRSICNPLTQNCANAIDLRNVESLELDSVDFTSSAGSLATTAWLYLENCYGNLSACNFGALSPAGFLKGVINILGCVLKGTSGLNIIDGIILEKGNRVDLSGGHGFFSDGSPTLHFEGGMSNFGPGVQRSYSFPSNVNAAGRIYRRAIFDASVEGPVVAATGIAVTSA